MALSFIFLLVFVFIMMLFLFPRVLYIITALYYFFQSSSQQKSRKRSLQFSLKDFKEFKGKKIRFGK